MCQFYHYVTKTTHKVYQNLGTCFFYFQENFCWMKVSNSYRHDMTSDDISAVRFLKKCLNDPPVKVQSSPNYANHQIVRHFDVPLLACQLSLPQPRQRKNYLLDKYGPFFCKTTLKSCSTQLLCCAPMFKVFYLRMQALRHTTICSTHMPQYRIFLFYKKCVV